MAKKPVITQAIHNKNIFFIFRDNNIEIKVTVNNGILNCDTMLYNYEIEYIKKQIK